MQTDSIIPAVKYWLEKTIIGFNFCPFAKKEFVNDRIHFEVVDENNREEMLLSLAHEFERLDNNVDIETTLVIYPKGLESFFDYLDFVELAEQLNMDLENEGVYQLATFHPDYCFADTQQDDVSNFTNRSPFPLIHIIREDSLEKVLLKYPNPELIPEKNIEIANEQGKSTFETILTQSLSQKP